MKLVQFTEQLNLLTGQFVNRNITLTESDSKQASIHGTCSLCFIVRKREEKWKKKKKSQRRKSVDVMKELENVAIGRNKMCICTALFAAYPVTIKLKLVKETILC